MTTVMGNSLFIKFAVEHELEMARMYTILKPTFPEHEELLVGLTEDESWHADLINQLGEHLQSEEVQLLPNRIQVKPIVMSLDRIRKKLTTVEKWGVDKDSALGLMANMESCEIEQKIFAGFATKNAEIRQVLSETIQCNIKHMEIIEDLRAACKKSSMFGLGAITGIFMRKNS